MRIGNRDTLKMKKRVRQNYKAHSVLCCRQHLTLKIKVKHKCSRTLLNTFNIYTKHICTEKKKVKIRVKKECIKKPS